MVRRNSPARIASRNNAKFRQYVRNAGDLALLQIVFSDEATPEELAILAEEGSYDIRYIVAGHPNCTESTLVYLAEDAEDASVQVALIYNLSVTLHVLKTVYPCLPLLFKAHVEEAVPKWSGEKIDTVVEEILGFVPSGLPYSWKTKLIISTVTNEDVRGTDND